MIPQALSSLQLLAQAGTEESKAPLYVAIAVIVVLLALVIAVIAYVARRSRSFTPSVDDDE